MHDVDTRAVCLRCLYEVLADGDEAGDEAGGGAEGDVGELLR